MFVYKPTTAMLIGNAPCGRLVFFSVSSSLSKCGVSCKYDGILGTKSLVWWSTKRLMFSVMEPHPLMIGLAGGRSGSLKGL